MNGGACGVQEGTIHRLPGSSSWRDFEPEAPPQIQGSGKLLDLHVFMTERAEMRLVQMRAVEMYGWSL